MRIKEQGIGTWCLVSQCGVSGSFSKNMKIMSQAQKASPRTVDNLMMVSY